MSKVERIYEAINNLIADVKDAKLPCRAIIIFGSIARGDYNHLSDLDLCVIHQDGLDEEQLLNAKVAIQKFISDKVGGELEVNYVYCTMENYRTGVSVFESIRTEGKILYENLLGCCAG